jgi:hypothetical protein
MKIRARKDITRVIREDRKAVDDAVAKGVRDAMLRHKKEDAPVVVQRNGKIELVKPEDLGY